jgi:hypothetical protein
MHRSLLRDSPQCYSPNLVEGGFSEVELPLYGVLRSSHDPHRLSQSVLRIVLHSVPFRGSAIVPTISFFLS